MNRTGLARSGEEDEAVRWIAVRHADDHIHLVVMLARQDGRRPSVRNDRYRVRDACRAAERRYGLRSTSPADRTAPRYPTRAENEKAEPARPGRGAPGHLAPRGEPRRGLVRDRGGVLRPPGSRGDHRPPRLQHEEPRPGHRVRRRAERRHEQGRRARSGTPVASSPPTSRGPSSPCAGTRPGR